jgi:hypothetical protein
MVSSPTEWKNKTYSTPPTRVSIVNSIYSNWLVVLTLKNMKVNGKDYPIYCGK